MRVSYPREIFQKNENFGGKKRKFKKKRKKEAFGTSSRAETRLTVYRSLYIMRVLCQLVGHGLVGRLITKSRKKVYR